MARNFLRSLSILISSTGWVYHAAIPLMANVSVHRVSVNGCEFKILRGPPLWSNAVLFGVSVATANLVFKTQEF